LRVDFADRPTDQLTLRPGQALVLPPGTKSRAYRWPRDAVGATVFLAAYEPKPPVDGQSAGGSPAGEPSLIGACAVAGASAAGDHAPVGGVERYHRGPVA
jgi:hypothetical protein